MPDRKVKGRELEEQKLRQEYLEFEVRRRTSRQNKVSVIEINFLFNMWIHSFLNIKKNE